MRRERCDLSIVLPARAENVSVVRHLVGGFGEQHGMRGPGLDDLRTVVTEACMNVVAHAYDDGSGRLQVKVVPRLDGVTVCVRDFGAGIRPDAGIDGTSLRLGLALIAALTSSLEIRDGLGGGTEVRMHVRHSGWHN